VPISPGNDAGWPPLRQRRGSGFSHEVMCAAEDAITSGEDLRPNLAVLLSAGSAVALISTLSLPLPVAIASSLLGALMIAGAEVDARTYLLPDTVTWGAITLGILSAPVLNPFEPWLSAGAAVARAACTALALVLLRWGYGRLRSREGLGFGDVKLAAAVGAWLPLACIPFCFTLATCTALGTVMLGRLRGESFSLLGAKRLELLHELVPNVAIVAVLLDPENPAFEVPSIETAAHALGLRIVPVKVASERDLDAAFARILATGAGAILFGGGPVLRSQLEASRRAGGATCDSNDLRTARLRRSRWPDQLCGQLPRGVSPSGRLCRPHSQGCETVRIAGPATDHVRAGDQPQNRQGFGPHRARQAARSR